MGGSWVIPSVTSLTERSVGSIEKTTKKVAFHFTIYISYKFILTLAIFSFAAFNSIAKWFILNKGHL